MSTYESPSAPVAAPQDASAPIDSADNQKLSDSDVTVAADANALFDLSGRRAIVTGGSQGLGRSVAIALAMAGAEVAVIARREERLRETTKAISAFGRRVTAHAADLSDVQAAQNAIDAASETLGGLDILVTAAGAQLRKPALDVSAEEFDALVGVNLRGVFFCCQRAAKNMIASDRTHRAKIINFASLTAIASWPLVSVYGATKGAVVQLTRAFAAEWAEHGINVNAIGPGTFRTELTAPIYDDVERVDQIMRRLPIKRPGEPQDLAGAALLLASSASDYITGQVIWVDGGWLSV